MLHFWLITTLIVGSLWSGSISPILAAASNSTPVIEIEIPEYRESWYQSSLIVDPYLSPYTGAPEILAFHDYLELTGITSWINKPGLLRAPLRAAYLFFIQDPLNYFLMLLQHEFFGHGYRVRLFGPDVAIVDTYVFDSPPLFQPYVSYWLDLAGVNLKNPFPYGEGNAATYYFFDPDIMTEIQDITIAIAGIESTQIAAHITRMHWLGKRKVMPLEVSLYLNLAHDSTFYILGADFFTPDDTGHDIWAYVWGLKWLYAAHNPITQQEIYKGIKRHSYINFVDPFTFLGIYAWFRYIVTGDTTPVPRMLIAGQRVYYYPALKLMLAPFGPETQVDHYLFINRHDIHFYQRFGGFLQNRYWGFGIEHQDLFVIKHFGFGYRLDVWNQPAFSKVTFNQVDTKQNFETPEEIGEYGGAASLIIKFPMDTGVEIYQDDKTTITWELPTFFMQIGYKSSGYLPGEALKAGILLRFGTTLPF